MEEGYNKGKKGRGQVKEHVYKEPMEKDNTGGGLNVGEGGGQGRGEQWGKNGDNCN